MLDAFYDYSSCLGNVRLRYLDMKSFSRLKDFSTVHTLGL